MREIIVRRHALRTRAHSGARMHIPAQPRLGMHVAEGIVGIDEGGAEHCPSPRRQPQQHHEHAMAMCIASPRTHLASHLRPRVSRPIPLMAGRREFGPEDEKNFSHVTLCLRFIYRDFSSSGRPVARISRPRGGRSVSVPGGPDQAPHHLNSLEVAWTKVMMGCVGAGIVEAPQFSMA